MATASSKSDIDYGLIRELIPYGKGADSWVDLSIEGESSSEIEDILACLLEVMILPGAKNLMRLWESLIRKDRLISIEISWRSLCV